MPRFRPSLEPLEQRSLPSVTPSLSITAGPAVVLGAGTRLTATAVLANGQTPTGYIEFTLSAPNMGTADAEIAEVNGNGSYSTPTGFVPSAPGTYQWTAKYSGDSSNLTVSTQPGVAPEQVTSTGLTLSTTTGGSVVVGSGGTLTDSALIAGGTSPNGTITFTLTSPTGVAVSTQTAAVTANGTYNTATAYTPTVAGTYTWTASFTGSNNSQTVTGLTSTETEVVTAVGPTLTNTPGATVDVGSTGSLTDSVTLAGADSPTGDLLFTLTAPNGAIVDTQVVPVNGNATYALPTGFVPTGTDYGTYKWTVTYSGDTNNQSVTSAAGTEMYVLPSPTLTITPGGTILEGSGKTLTASATLAGGSTPTGTITFYLFAPGVTPTATESNSVFSSAVTSTGDGKYSLTTGYTPTTTGTYEWLAVYGGNTSNGSITSAVGTEKYTLPTPTLGETTGATVSLGTTGKLTDSVVLSGGSSPTGKLTFYLFAPGVTPNARDTNAVYSVTETVTGKGTYSTPKAYLPTEAGLYHWLVLYSGNEANNAVTLALVAESVESLRWQRG